ncbi:MAG: hypothetical protein DRP45_00410 [Candidatus Zixiibacteriota bacterium]|nr:MAG: hypothetical protein DRP45_00410 [candidate division Zixibacteria bacterium]
MTRFNEDELQRLVKKATGGDREAFSAIVRQMMQPITALTYRMTGDRDTALDLAQETFVTAWQNLAGFRGEASFASWMYRIATNKTLNHIKAAQRHSAIEQSEISEQTSAISGNPEREFARKELATDVAAFMTTLPPAQRAIFELRFYREMTFEEIATAVDRAVGTVKTGYREAVKKLRVFAREKEWHS